MCSLVVKADRLFVLQLFRNVLTLNSLEMSSIVLLNNSKSGQHCRRRPLDNAPGRG